MTLVQQLKQVFICPIMIGRGKASFYVALLAYTALGLLIFGSFGYLLIQNQDAIQKALMSYLLPQSWHYLSAKLLDFFFESQTKIVVASMIINGSMVLASLLLFPLKEYCSARFEQDRAYNNGHASEFPLWLQALEESKLLFLYLTAQSIIFAIGYYPYAWCSWLSNSLSIIFLCFSFSLDLISPTLQRHRIRYSSILKLLMSKPLISFLFGGFFALPLLSVGNWVFLNSHGSLAEIATWLFLINILILALAIPAGTHVASTLLHEAKRQTPPSRLVKGWSYSVLTALLVVSGGFHSLVALSMHHKSQILKCDYDLDWNSLDADLPGFAAFFRGEKAATLTFDLIIHNPTPFNLEVEDSTLSLWQYDQLISRTHISHFAVSSGASVIQSMKFSMELNAQRLSGIDRLTEGWQAQLEFELLPGIPFQIQLLGHGSSAGHVQNRK